MTGALPAWSGIVHQAALPPLDLFADVRLLTARASSYPAFVAGLATSLTARVVLLAWALGGLSRQRLVFALRIYLVALVPAHVAAALAFTGHALSYAWFAWAAIALTLVTALLLTAAPWAGLLDVRRATRWSLGHRRCVGVAAAYLLGVLSVGALSQGPVASVAAMWASAALAAVTARHGFSRPARRRGDTRVQGSSALVPVVAVLSFALVPDAQVLRPHDHVLFLVPGVSTSSGRGAMFHADPTAMGFSCGRTSYFSYAGPGEGAPQRDAVCPITAGAPYDHDDTQAPLDHLVRAFHDQVVRLPAPAVVIAHSQGAWIAAEAIARDPSLDVAALVMLGPHPVQDVGYEPPGGDAAPRRDAIRVVLAGVEQIDRTRFRPGAPLARQLLATPGAVDRIMSRPLPDVRVLAVTSWHDLVVTPRGWRVDGARNACPVLATHGSLPHAAAVHDVIVRFLTGDEVDACPWWRTALAPVTAPFAVPPDRQRG